MIAGAKQWFYLTGEGDNAQTHGPFDVRTIKDLFEQGYVTEDALVWAEGEREWLPLKACNELFGELTFKEATLQPEPQRDAQLQDFEAEIAAVEAGVPLVCGGALHSDDASPGPDDQEFEEGGVTYRWDSNVRKYLPDNLPADPALAPQATASLPEYTADMMRFEASAEPVVTIEEARAAEEESAALAEKLAGAKEQGVKRTVTQGAEASEEAECKAARSDATASTSKPTEGTSGPGKVDGKPEWFELKNNTSVYVSGLPDGVTEDEIAQEFSRCGVIKQNDDGTPKIKLYRDRQTGLMKGDGLVTFLLRPSVRIATTIMHDRPLRPGGAKAMHVQEAQFQMKGDFVAQKGKSQGKNNKGKKKAAMQKDKVLSWSGFDDVHKASEVTVVLMGLFTMDEMVLSPDLEGEVTAYVLERCKDLGAVDRVRVYRKSAAGVATVKFRLPEAATACIARFSATVMLTRMFTRAAIVSDPTLAKVIVEDAILKCAQLGVPRAAELTIEGAARSPVWPLRGSSSGRVALACASRDAAAAAVTGMQGLGYAGESLQAAAVIAQMWDGVTSPNAYGQAQNIDETARLEAFEEELVAR